MTRPDLQLKVLSRKTSRFQGYCCESDTAIFAGSIEIKLTFKYLHSTAWMLILI